MQFGTKIFVTHTNILVPNYLDLPTLHVHVQVHVYEMNTLPIAMLITIYACLVYYIHVPYLRTTNKLMSKLP